MKSVAFHNLGCKVNSYELDLMQENVTKNGWHIVPFDRKADVYIINTCSVTNIADRKSRQMLHRAKSLNPDAIVVAVGCYVQSDAFALAQDEGVNLLVGNNKKSKLAAILDEYICARNAGTLSLYADRVLGGKTVNSDFSHETAASVKEENSEEYGNIGETDNMKLPTGEDIAGSEKEVRAYLEKTLGNTTVLDLKKVPFEEGNIVKTESHTRAYIKIQDGCDRYCSYCIIPYTRGNVRSKPIDEVVEEAKLLVSSGVREIVLTGIHVSSYGVDFINSQTEGNEFASFGEQDAANEKDPRIVKTVSEIREQKSAISRKALLTLLQKLQQISGLERIRLSSFEPLLISADFMEGLGRISKICPHFHLSLQSGCDETLKRMNRRYTTEEFAEKVALIRDVFPDAAITTDVIVGFPEETEKEFNTTVEFAKKIGFYEMHVFKYSRRKGTPADANPDQVPEQVKNTRSDTLLELTAVQSKEFRKRFLNKTVEVLFEEEKEINGRRYWLGHTKEYVLVAIFSSENLENKIMKVETQDFLRDDVLLARSSVSAL